MTMLPRIRQLLASMDDDALAALANRGLLRRAKKDLETVTPKIIEANDTIVRLQVDDCEVTIPDIPANARSNSPAGNIDRYVLMAFLWLKEQPENSGNDADYDSAKTQTPEMLDDDALAAWAGKALFRKTLGMLTDELPCLVENEQPLTIRVPHRNIVCRWMTGGNLDTMIVTGPGKDTKSDGLLAILLYQIAKGVRTRPAATLLNAPDASSGTPRTRVEVLDSLGIVLREMIAMGLTRLSEATQQRLQTLAVSAHGVDLPRLERMIQALADDIGLQRKRNSQASTTKLLASAARIDALRRSLKNRLDPSNATGIQTSKTQTPLADLIGEHRSRYHAVGDIELIGMGARRWTTQSGYVGLTVYFWDRSADHWATWSDSRPVGTPGFDPVAVYHNDGPWQGCSSPMFASQNVVKLLGAYRNDNGRLSARRTTQAIGREIDDVTAVLPPQMITNWASLWDRATRLFGGGLSRRNEQDEIVFLKTTRWEPPIFDEISQRVVRQIIDTEGVSLPLVAVHDDTQAAEMLEHYDPVNNMGILGLLRMLAGIIVIEPVSLFDDRGIHNLTLSTTNQSFKRSKTQTTIAAAESDSFAEENDNDDINDTPMENSLGRIGDLLHLLQLELESYAESGLGVARDTESLAVLTKRLKAVGLTVCAAPLEHFTDKCRHARQSLDSNAVFQAAESLLQSYYVIVCAMQ